MNKFQKLLEVQSKIGTLSKNSDNPFFKSKYLDLSSLLSHVTPLLNESGLLLIQPIDATSVSTIIVEAETGEDIAKSSIFMSEIANPQKLGSAITYYRRYTLKSLLAIAEDDDDGNSAAKKPKVNYTEKLNNCKNITELANLWKSIPASTEKTALETLKEELKIKLTK